jgi:multiple sugar transport system substrate-binding protein
MRQVYFIRTILASLFAVLICSAGFGLAWARTIESVSFLMAAPFADASQDLVKQFNKEHRGEINLKVIRGPLETEAMSDLAISSLLLGKAPFDVLLMDITWLPKYAAAGWMVPLENYFNKDDVDSLAKGAREGNSYNGHLYRWPLTSDMGLLYYRTDLMDLPPETPQDLILISQTLQKDLKVD